MKELTNKRTKRLQSEIEGTDIAINYNVTLETEGKKEVSTAIFGTVLKGEQRVGAVNYQKAADHLHISFAPMTGTTPEERAQIAAIATANVDELLK